MVAKLSAGLSLLEILIATAILAALMIVAVPSLWRTVGTANDTATRAYLHHVVKGVESSRDIVTFRLPESQSCAALVRLRRDPLGVAGCVYTPDFTTETYTVTATSVTGATFRYDGSEIVQLE